MTTHYSVRIFDGTYETDRYADLALAEEHVARSVEFIDKEGLDQSPPVIVPVEAEGETHICVVCERAVVTAKNPDITPFCKSCFYVGSGHEYMRSEQLARFAEAFPGAEVAVDHTGGGCFWVSFRWPGEPKYYVITDGEAGLPTNPDGSDYIGGGWGYVGRHDDTEDEANYDSGDFEGTVLAWGEDALEDPANGLSDDAVIAVISADLARRQTAQPEVVSK